MNITFHNSHYSRVCAQYSDFLYKAQLLTQKLLDQIRLYMLLLGWSLRYSILRSSSRKGWPLPNINSSSDNGTFAFWVELCPLSPTRHLPDLAMRYPAVVVYEIGTAYSLRALGFNPEFLVRGVAHVFSFFVSCAQRFLCHWIVYSWMFCGFHWRFL